MPAKGDLEIVYGSPWGGVDFSRPYNVLDPQFLAPGSINTSQINGFLTSSPWLASSPYSNVFAGNEFPIGFFKGNVTNQFFFTPAPTIVVTNLAVYYSSANSFTGSALNPFVLNLLHTWAPAEINAGFLAPGNDVSFQEVAGIVYFTGLMLNGIFSVNLNPGFPGIFATATTFVSAAYLIELGGYLFAAECRFPTGGGTGTSVLPTVAWSGPGQYSGSGASDPWNPVNQLGGGFNQLSDVPDTITGLAGIGRSALIFRNNGVSQCDPNPGTSNSGLQPFTFYHLWASAQGVGAYPGTVAQFGQTVYFRSSDNVYSISISGGLQPVGPRIIAKINADERASKSGEGATFITSGAPSYWYFSSIVVIGGQLHYWLCFSAYNVNPVTLSQQFTALVYDYNIAENAWHVSDFSSYLQASGTPQPFLCFSCRPAQITEQTQTRVLGTGVTDALYPQFILVGAYTGLGTVNAAQQFGVIDQLVPWDYDFASQWINAFNASLYPPLAMPPTTIVFRAEVISLGHKTTQRRLRIQADNAPLPSFAAGSQQQGTVTLTGSLPQNVRTGAIQWTRHSGAGGTVPYMQGNIAPQGAPIQTYYGNAVVSDELVQASIASTVADPNNPWNSLPAFRIATASLVAEDPKSTTA